MTRQTSPAARPPSRHGIPGRRQARPGRETPPLTAAATSNHWLAYLNRLLPVVLAVILALGTGSGLVPGRLTVAIPIWGPSMGPTPVPENLDPAPVSFSFAVAADMRLYSGSGAYDSQKLFRGATEAIAMLDRTQGKPSAFMISPGDFDPAPGVLWTITSTLGITYTWYPVIGNHDLPGGGEESELGANLRWLQEYNLGDVRPGPAGCPTTTYSLDYGDAHFAMLNVYCDAQGPFETDGDVPDHLYRWLSDDLAATDKRYVFVVGHEPAFPLPDADNGRLRHLGDSLDAHPANRDRFWSLLRERGVAAYICGHTHNYSAARIDGVWQVDAGHARGMGDAGAPSTFVMIQVTREAVSYATYRADERGMDYRRSDVGYLVSRVKVPLILRRRPLSRWGSTGRSPVPGFLDGAITP